MQLIDLMINDLIYVHHTNTKPIVVKVLSIESFGDGEIVVTVIDECTKELSIGKDSEFSPIPLTDKILKINGWIIESNSGYNAYTNSICKITESSVEIQGEHFLIKSVHEFQHYLRLCGHNNLANNFKIG